MAIDVELAVSSETDAVPRGRRWLAVQVEASAAMLQYAQLMLSELLSNALLHGLAPIVVRFRPTGDGLWVEAPDGSRRSLVIPVRSRETMTGRGLALIAALSDSWGMEVAMDGNTAWAEVSGPIAAKQHIDTVVRELIFERASRTEALSPATRC